MTYLIIAATLVIFFILHFLSRTPLDGEECEGTRHATKWQ